ncbi:uncharacterized protein V1518DRAFT_413396, partial [Limtongia smithiae]|uniref:uncharacterized protein n=1 Tax=Limtongia smithiae TaxID=1125753 RepID=UPI0034CD50F1
MISWSVGTTYSLKAPTNMSPVVLITGASRGLGAAIAQMFLDLSYNVVLVARTAGPLEAFAAKYPSQVAYLAGDISLDSVNVAAVNLAIEKFGKLDACVYNAAILDPITAVGKADANAWRKLYDINFFALVASLGVAVKYLKESKGSVVFISSGATHHYFYGWGAYGSSKAATDHLAATLAAEEPDIKTFSLDPGVMDTAMQIAIRDKHGAEMTPTEHDRFLKLKSENTLSPPELPGGVVVNMIVKGWSAELNGKALRFDSEELKEYAP